MFRFIESSECLGSHPTIGRSVRLEREASSRDAEHSDVVHSVDSVKLKSNIY